MTTLFHGESNNCCGYCKFHGCGVTVKQLKTKECLLKQCGHLVRNEEHQYWWQRECAARRRKERKARLAAMCAG